MPDMSGHKIADKGGKFSRFDNKEKGKNIYNVFSIHCQHLHKISSG